MVTYNNDKKPCGVFITFSGNCKKALTFYQSCFGGRLQFEPFEKLLQAYKEIPLVSGSLLADRITIHGSDLVQNEGRKPGNHMAIFLFCKDVSARKKTIEKLAFDKGKSVTDHQNRLVEITDAFDVRWVLGI